MNSASRTDGSALHGGNKIPHGGTQAILDLLLELDWYDWDPELYYHRFLEVALSLIPEGSMGTVSIKNPERWYFVASIGHEMEKLLELRLESSWCKASENSVREVPSLVNCFSEEVPHDVRFRADEALSNVQRSLLGTYSIDEGEQIILSIDIPKGTTAKEEHFSESSLRFFEAFLKLAGKYQSLTQQKIALQNI
ncbi:MAG: hypothetical protein SNJ56_05055, partial [Termitinemataceae bacterium]